MRVYVCQLYRRWLVCRIHAHLLQYMLALMIGGRRGGRHRASHLKCTTERDQPRLHVVPPSGSSES